MWAFQVAANPDILKAPHGAVDKDTGEPVDPDHLRRCHIEYAEAINFIADLQGGLFHLTYTDYHDLPAALVDCYRLWLKYESERKNKK